MKPADWIESHSIIAKVLRAKRRYDGKLRLEEES